MLFHFLDISSPIRWTFVLQAQLLLPIHRSTVGGVRIQHGAVGIIIQNLQYILSTLCRKRDSSGNIAIAITLRTIASLRRRTVTYHIPLRSAPPRTRIEPGVARRWLMLMLMLVSLRRAEIYYSRPQNFIFARDAYCDSIPFVGTYDNPAQLIPRDPGNADAVIDPPSLVHFSGDIPGPGRWSAAP